MDFKVKTREEGTVPTWGLKKGVRNKRETPIYIYIYIYIGHDVCWCPELKDLQGKFPTGAFIEKAKKN